MGCDDSSKLIDFIWRANHSGQYRIIVNIHEQFTFKTQQSDQLITIWIVLWKFWAEEMWVEASGIISTGR